MQITIWIPDDLYRRYRALPHFNVSKVCQKAIGREVERAETEAATSVFRYTLGSDL